VSDKANSHLFEPLYTVIEENNPVTVYYLNLEPELFPREKSTKYQKLCAFLKKESPELLEKFQKSILLV